MKRWKEILAAAAVVSVLAAWPAAAAEMNPIQNDWQNENLGPGVARWVDESGNVSEQTGVRPGAEEEQLEVPAGPWQDVEEAQAATDGQSQEQTGTQEQSQAGEETAPAEEGGEQDPAAAGDQSREQGGEQEAAAGRVIDPACPMVALTFDDGPQPSVGNRIMDCLAQYNGKATFYVVGNRASSHAAELQRMVAEGHEIGNHSYSHKYFNTLSTAQIRQEVDRCADAVQAACGVRPVTVRLPGGNKNATVLAAVQEPIVLWSIDTLDWKTKNASKTVSAVLDNVKDGDIILMHELYQASGDAALQIIPELHNRGYQMVTVSEMAQYRRGGWQNGQVYYSMRP